MAFMVKNPGLIPGMKSLRDGDVGKRRKGMAEILQGCWRSCADANEVGGDEDSTPKAKTLRRACHHREPAEFRAYPLCSEAGDPIAFDVHVSLDLGSFFLCNGSADHNLL